MALRSEKWHRDIISEIAKEEGIDSRVVDFAATHPLLFTSRVIRDPKDNKPIRLRYLGIFAIRNWLKKK